MQIKKSKLMLVSSIIAFVLSLFFFLSIIFFIILLTKNTQRENNTYGIIALFIVIFAFPVCIFLGLSNFICGKFYFIFAKGKDINNNIMSKVNGCTFSNLYLLPSIIFIISIDKEYIIIAFLQFVIFIFLFVIPQIILKKRKEEIKKKLFNL